MAIPVYTDKMIISEMELLFNDGFSIPETLDFFAKDKDSTYIYKPSSGQLYSLAERLYLEAKLETVSGDGTPGNPPIAQGEGSETATTLVTDPVTESINGLETSQQGVNQLIMAIPVYTDKMIISEMELLFNDGFSIPETLDYFAKDKDFTYIYKPSAGELYSFNADFKQASSDITTRVYFDRQFANVTLSKISLSDGSSTTNIELIGGVATIDSELHIVDSPDGKAAIPRSAIETMIGDVALELDDHIQNITNPHQVTPEQLGINDTGSGEIITDAERLSLGAKLETVSVDDVTITGDGTPGNPLTAQGEGSETATTLVSDSATESINGLETSQQGVNQGMVVAVDGLGSAVQQNTDAIAALASASMVLTGVPLAVVPTTETRYDFTVTTPSDDTTLLDADDATNVVTYKKENERYVGQTHFTVKTSGTPDKTITINYRKESDDTVFYTQTVDIEGKNSFISHVVLPVFSYDNLVDDFEFYFTLQASDNEIELLEADTNIATNSVAVGAGSLWDFDGTVLKPKTNPETLALGGEVTGVALLEVHKQPIVAGGVAVTNAEAGYDGEYAPISATLYSKDSTHHLQNSGWYWIMCSDFNDPWNTGVAEGAGGKVTPDDVVPYIAIGSGTATPMVASSTSTVSEAIATDGKIYAGAVIKSGKGFDVGGRFFITRDSLTDDPTIHEETTNGVYLSLEDSYGIGETHSVDLNRNREIYLHGERFVLVRFGQDSAHIVGYTNVEVGELNQSLVLHGPKRVVLAVVTSANGASLDEDGVFRTDQSSTKESDADNASRGANDSQALMSYGGAKESNDVVTGWRYRGTHNDGDVISSPTIDLSNDNFAVHEFTITIYETNNQMLIQSGVMTYKTGVYAGAKVLSEVLVGVDNSVTFVGTGSKWVFTITSTATVEVVIQLTGRFA